MRRSLLASTSRYQDQDGTKSGNRCVYAGGKTAKHFCFLIRRFGYSFLSMYSRPVDFDSLPPCIRVRALARVSIGTNQGNDVFILHLPEAATSHLIPCSCLVTKQISRPKPRLIRPMFDRIWGSDYLCPMTENSDTLTNSWPIMHSYLVHNFQRATHP